MCGLFESRRIASMALCVALAAGSLCAAADTRPVDGGEWFRNNGNNGANNGGNNGNDAANGVAPNPGPPIGADPRDSFRREGARDRYDSPYSDYPGFFANNWVMASVRAAAARAIFRRAESDLSASIRRAQLAFEKSPELRQAEADEKAGYDAYIATRQEALKSVFNDPSYRAILSLRDDLAQKLAIRRADHDISKDEILAMATLKLSYASDARAMEVAALEGDNNLKQARARMVAQSQKVSQLRANFDDSIRTNNDILYARRNLEDARINLVAAEAFANGSAIAGDAALNYAYFLHRNDQGSNYATGYGGIGSYGGGGIYSPYWVRY